jgi:phytoene dehydrogenase-like protein
LTYAHDVVVIGGGHNGLVTAAFLAKGGLKTVVLERTDRPGGCARTSEVAPGFRGPTLAHIAAIDWTIVRALDLERHGLQIVRPAADICAPTLDGRALVLWSDPGLAARDIARFSAHDAEQYPRFLQSFSRISRVLRAIGASAPPSIDQVSSGDLVSLLKTGRAFRGLGKADAYRLLRWIPMAVADLTSEWFESEPLRATIASGGTLGSFLGPRSAGSAAVLLMLGAAGGLPSGAGWFARGGIGAVADALATSAHQAGAQIRTGIEATAITITGGAATGVITSTGESLAARAVVSNLDPRRTLLQLVDPVHLPPEFVRRVQNIRARGTLAKMNFAVGEVPRPSGLALLHPAEQLAALSGRVRLVTDTDSIERAFDAAKYGEFSETPWIELTVPSITDPSLAPQGRHVVSAYIQYAPYQLRGTTWDEARDRLADRATRTIERYVPGFARSILAHEILTPLDLERTYGLTGGHVFHGELALDQLFIARPLLGWSRYRTPIDGLYLCGCGTHPGTGLDGRSGALAAKAIARDLKR